MLSREIGSNTGNEKAVVPHQRVFGTLIQLGSASAVIGMCSDRAGLLIGVHSDQQSVVGMHSGQNARYLKWNLLVIQVIRVQRNRHAQLSSYTVIGIQK
jgi:hypothetical protein